MLNLLWFIAPISSVIALLTARYFHSKLILESEGNEKMKTIAGYVKEGAMAYLKRQYRVVSVVFAILFILLVFLVFIGVQNVFVPILFLSGGFWSALSGYVGMKTATSASARTAAACEESLNKGLKVSFRAGAIMGLVVVGFGLLDLSIWFTILNYFYDHNVFNLSQSILNSLNITTWDNTLVNNLVFQKHKYSEIATTLLTYSMGASVMALFSRVGGGIFTKAADVGADLVGKVEANIPEDDPRNPATIADNVGDNVGDVAGMGADLYESYCGSILAATALGASIVLSNNHMNLSNIFTPMIIAGGGILFSIIGIFLVKTKENATQKDLLKSLHLGTNVSSILILIFLSVLAYIDLITWGIFGAVAAGLISGILIGQATEYYTSAFPPALSAIGPNASVAKVIPKVDNIPIAAKAIP